MVVARPCEFLGAARIGAAVCLVLGLGAVPDVVTADTKNAGAVPFRAALADALGGEQAALSAFSATPDFARAAGLERIEAPESGDIATSRAALDAHIVDDAGAGLDADGKLAAVTPRAPGSDGAQPMAALSLSAVTVTKKSKQWYCLTEALYFEARGESLNGQIAVAEVILNRVDSHLYPGTICAVVQQGQHRHNACQFSYNCDGRKNRIRNQKVFDRLGRIAWVMMQGRPRTLTGEALYYHNTSVRPRWSKKFVRTAKIGEHIFYRRPVKLSKR